jgi:hypothetical protein
VTITPTQDDVASALRSFMLDRLPEGVDVIQGIENRVAEPTEPNFIVTWFLRTARIETNVDTPEDVKFTGAIAAATAAFTGSIAPAPREQGVMPYGILTVTAVSAGSIVEGSLLTGGGVLGQTFVTAQISGTPGGAGSYAVSRAQDIVSGSLGTSYGVLTVSAVEYGAIAVGATIFGTGVTAGTRVREFGTGTGGTGTYIVAPSQTVASRTLSAGSKTIRMNSIFTVQIDFHSGSASPASDMAQTISAALRDAYATTFFADLTGGTIMPLYADDPRYGPFNNENQQLEWRWTLDANLQVNQTIRVPLEFADSAEVVLIELFADAA